MANDGSKTRLLGEILEKTCVCIRGHIFSPIIIKPFQYLCLVEMSVEYKNGSKTRSLSQILEKPCVRSRGHIFNSIIMKLYKDVCLHEISHKFENGSCWVKN